MADVEKNEAIEANPVKSNDPVKTKLLLVTEPEHGFSNFQSDVKSRGVKSVDLASIVADALALVPKEWWDAKIEELTPLEFKLNSALGDPTMREKLSQFLAQSKDGHENKTTH